MKKGILLIILILPSLFIQAQNSDEPFKEYFLDAEYFFAREEYMDALVDYLELYNNGFNTYASINYRIGICYLKISGQKDKSIPYLLEAVKNIKNNNRDSKYKEEKAPMDAWLYLGNAYRINYKLNDAIEAYRHYQDILPSKDNIAREYVAKEIEACNSAQAFMQNPVKINKINFGNTINGSSANYKGVLSGDGRSLLYMNELPFYNAIYYSKLVNSEWTPPVNITPQIQSDGDQYVSSVSFDGTILYLSKDDVFNSDILMSRLKDSIWGKSEPIPGEINSKFWESHASISKDGKIMYFTSNRTDKGLGGMDIYKSELKSDNTWGTPVNLGNVINTAVNEDSPFITDDGKTLYFSSQGHRGMGGYDFYRSELQSDGQWSEPVNLGYPLCTTDDDLFYYPWYNGNYAIISAIEPTGYGKEDLYEIQIGGQDIVLKPIAELIKDIDNQLQMEKIASARVQEVVEKTADSPALVVKEGDESLVKDDTTVQTPVQEEKAETITEQVSVAVKKITIKPVYFAFDGIVLNDEGKEQLMEIALTLKEFQNLSVECIGYADAIGPFEYNMSLSLKRANTVFNYLLNTGVEARKLSTKGLGETNFAAINKNPDGTDNPEGRKYNRRVELKFSGTDANKLEIHLLEIPEEFRVK